MVFSGVCNFEIRATFIPPLKLAIREFVPYAKSISSRSRKLCKFLNASINVRRSKCIKISNSSKQIFILLAIFWSFFLIFGLESFWKSLFKVKNPEIGLLGNSKLFKVIHGHSWPFEVNLGHSRPFKVILGHSRSFLVILHWK